MLHSFGPLLALLLASLVSRAYGQTAWTQGGIGSNSAVGAMAFDEARGEAITFGPSGTWVWDGTTWTSRGSAAAPPTTGGFLMAYDRARQRTVLLALNGLLSSAQTWEWDGTSWTRHLPTLAPPLQSLAMTYDSNRGRCSLIVGTGSPQVDEVWEWDGVTWSRYAAATGPTDTGYGCAVAFDELRGKLVLFGGRRRGGGSSARGDAWEWDGTAWARLATGPALADHAMTYDHARQRLLVYDAAGTWEFDGSVWTQLQPLRSPLPRSKAGLVWDRVRGQVLLAGGYVSTAYWKVGIETWAWDGTIWTELSTPIPHSSGSVWSVAHDSVRSRTVLVARPGPVETWEWDGARWNQAATQVRPGFDGPFAFDAARAVCILLESSKGVTWQWDGVTWTKLAPQTSPPPWVLKRMAYDSARQRIVAFGPPQTWEWDGTDWAQRFALVSPTARDAALSYDSVRRRVVLCGGTDSSGFPVHETWEWDGTSWTRRSTNGPAQVNVTAYDSGRSRVVAVSSPPLGARNQTWEWDGTTWTQRQPRVVPVLSLAHGMAYDAARGRVVAVDYDGSTWEWDGTDWVNRSPGIAPPSLWRHAMAFDEQRAVGVLFGGTDASGLAQADTWEWQGGIWSQAAVAAAPDARTYGAMGFDATRGRVVLFGGLDRSLGYLADTWEYAAGSWKRLVPVTSPLARAGHAVAFDRSRGRLLLFGGVGTASFGDTWDWDGTVWTMRAPAASPPARSRHAMAYDEARDRVVLFGGQGAGLSADTWEWDGQSWRILAPSTAPSARSGHAMAYDRARSRVVLFGGRGGRGELRDSWEWDGTTWTQRADGTILPAARADHGMAYDTAMERITLFGGGMATSTVPMSDTWHHASVAPATFVPFGSGCVGTAGVPRISASFGARPWIGDTLVASVVGLPPVGAVALYLGGSDSTWGTYGLPLSLSPYGMPGCTVFSALDIAIPVNGSGGVGLWSVTLPSNSWLVGQSFYCQAVVADPGANAAGATLSDARAARIGSR